MASINSVHLLGNLTRDPEVRYTPKGQAVADISIACNRVWYDEQNQKHEEVDFFDVTVFGKQAENCAKYVGKGCRLHVQGRLKQETWEDKATGQRKSKVKVIADSLTYIDFLETNAPQQPAAQPRQTTQPQRQQPAQGQGRSQAPAARPAGRPMPRPSREQSPFINDDNSEIQY